MATEVKVPDIGDFEDVPVIEILVEPGQEVQPEDPLVTLESEKATMDVPAPDGGTVGELLVEVGDKVSEGTPILTLETAEGGDDEPDEEEPDVDPKQQAEDKPAPAAASQEPEEDADLHAEVLVFGSGPGGYTAAFRAADLGAKTVLVERYDRLGGVCLNVGCIPSKALLHVAGVIAEAEHSEEIGLKMATPEVDLEKLRGFKDGAVKQLTGGLVQLAKQRKVEVVHGRGTFASPHRLEVETSDGTTSISFDHAIIAVGSRAAALPVFPEDDRIVDSTGALELPDVPERMLVVGGGVIGLEMATVYDALGSKVTVVELSDGLIPGCDRDLVKPLEKRISGRYEAIHLGMKVDAVEPQDDGLHVTFASGDDGDAPEAATYDRILVAVGRVPNGAAIGADAAGVEVDERGFIAVDGQLRTNVAHIHAIGDVVPGPMLAHKALHEGKVAAEAATGDEATAFDVRSIPAVAYTDPEAAWRGLTETEAKAQDIPYEKGQFPWAASGRALALGRTDGLTKILIDPETKRILGAGMVGTNAGELVAETVHAIEMGANAEDLALSIHPHPTLAETVGLAAESADGTITDLYQPKRRRARDTEKTPA